MGVFSRASLNWSGLLIRLMHGRRLFIPSLGPSPWLLTGVRSAMLSEGSLHPILRLSPLLFHRCYLFPHVQHAWFYCTLICCASQMLLFFNKLKAGPSTNKKDYDSLYGDAHYVVVVGMEPTISLRDVWTCNFISVFSSPWHRSMKIRNEAFGSSM